MTKGSVSLDDILQTYGNFGECLLHDLRMTKYGYGLDISFNIIWGADGYVRNDVLERPIIVTFRLLGVDLLHFVGGLTDAMKVAPEEVGWGLSEVSQVRQFETETGLGMSVQWEGQRRLNIEFQDFEVRGPRLENLT